jgi:hypothetical protein
MTAFAPRRCWSSARDKEIGGGAVTASPPVHDEPGRGSPGGALGRRPLAAHPGTRGRRRAFAFAQGPARPAQSEWRHSDRHGRSSRAQQARRRRQEWPSCSAYAAERFCIPSRSPCFGEIASRTDPRTRFRPGARFAQPAPATRGAAVLATARERRRHSAVRSRLLGFHASSPSGDDAAARKVRGITPAEQTDNLLENRDSSWPWSSGRAG